MEWKVKMIKENKTINETRKEKKGNKKKDTSLM